MDILKSISLKYLIGIVVVLSIILSSIFVVFYTVQKNFLFEEVHNQAQIVINQILITRKWISDMGGIYVVQTKNLKPNKFLIRPLIKCDNITFLARNPAMVTRELSEYAQKNGLFFFKLTSDYVINIKNSPCPTEMKAIRLFKAKKIKEFTEVEKINNIYFYRYMKPLFIKKSCLQCHLYQGYSYGDFRGCISVFIPINNLLNNLKSMKFYLIISSFMIMAITVLIIFFLNYILVIQPVARLKNSIDKFERNYSIELTPSTRKDEIGVLERSFSDMAIKIKNNYEIMQNEIQKATEELKRKDKMKTDFLATISHELRTPLTAIQGGIEYFFKVLKKEENLEFLKIIDKNLKNLILMVNNLIDIARIELGKIELELVKVNIKELIEEVTIFFKGFAHEKNIDIREDNLFDCFVEIDRRRINQVFINIIHNAIKYSPENETIKISMVKTENFVKISFKNKTVKKISEKDLPKFFEKYKYLSSDKEKGSGLGLAIAKAIVEAHGGKVDVSLKEEEFILVNLFLKITL